MDLVKLATREIKFIANIADMPFHKLRTEITESKKNLTTLDLDISKVISCIDSAYELESFIIDRYTLQLIEFIQQGNQLIPPFIVYVFDNKWSIFDGKHRIALFIKLGILNIPFLIRKHDLAKTIYLTN